MPSSRWIIVLLAAVIAITPLAIDMYLPAMPAIAASLSTPISTVQQSLSIYLAAYAIGMMMFGPLADMWGRRPLALFGLTGFTVSSAALVVVNDPSLFLTLRASQAFCGAAATVVVPGLVRYLYREHTAKGLSYMSMIMMLAPLLAPSIGSLVLWVSEWHSIFVVLSLYGLVILIAVAKFMPEITYPDDSPRVRPHFFTGYRVIFSHAKARPLILSLMSSSLAFFCFITAVSFIYIGYFGVSPQVFGLLFGANVIAMMLANFLNSRWVVRFGALKTLRGALGVALVSALVLMLIALLDGGLMATAMVIAPLISGIAIVSTNTDALVLMEFPDNTGTATAVTGTLRFGSGAAAGPLLAFFYTGNTVPFASIMLGGVVGVVLCQLYYAYRRNP